MSKIKKPDVVAHMMSTQHMPKETVDKFLNEFLNYVKTEVQNQNQVYLYEFGVFSQVKYQTRRGRNPRTNEPLLIPSHYAVQFKASEKFKRQVNHKK